MKKSQRNILVMALLIVLSFSTRVLAQNDTLYYDTKWKTTVKDSAAFFRPPAKKEGDLFRVQDYYVSGQLQMNALSKTSGKDIWEGKVTWYNEDGSMFQEATYENNRLDGQFITYLEKKQLVANYENGYFVSGTQLSPTSGFQFLRKKKGDSLIEIFFDKDIDSIRQEFYGKGKEYRPLSKYYGPNGVFLGEKTVLPNGVHKGIEVFYYAKPMRIKEIRHMPYGQYLTSSFYYENGQPREEFKQGETLSKTFYDKNGKQMGKMTYMLDRNYLKPVTGTEYFFASNYKEKGIDVIKSINEYNEGVLQMQESYHDNGALQRKTVYKNGGKEFMVSYNLEGKEIAKMIYDNYLPVEGTEIFDDRTVTYKGGKLVSETKFYKDSQKPFSVKDSLTETYYTKDGTLLGELTLTNENNYPKPLNGERFYTSYDDDISSIDTYKQGFLVQRTSFRKRLVGKDSSKTFKRVEKYTENGYERIKEIKYYSNGNLQSDIDFKGYKEVFGTFYDKNGNQLSTYNFKKKEGTYYKFFGDSDALELMEEYQEGKLKKRKRYTYGKEKEYGQINPVLLEDLDVDCCATYYTIDGKIIAETIFKDGKPWSGVAYDSNTRKKYTLKDGKSEGIYQKLDYNGYVMETGQFVNNMEEGTFKYYDYSNNLQRTEQFQEGKLEGKSVYYDKKGEIVAEITYAKGLPVDGTKIIGSYYGENPNTETYRNGSITERITYGKNGKSITRYTDGKVATTTAYFKDSDKKRLSYSLKNTYLDGPVIRYSEDGEEHHRAQFKNGKLESGTVYLTPDYDDTNLIYILVKKKTNTLSIVLMGLDNTVVLEAQENLNPGAVSKYIDKLNIPLNYLNPNRLY